MNCMKWRKRSSLCNLAPLRGRLAIGNGEVKRISRGSIRPLILFHRQLHKLCSSSDYLNSLARLNHTILYSLLRYSRQNQSLRSQRNQETANWIPHSSPPERTQCRQGSSSYHCSTRGDCSISWNRRLIDGGKPTCSTSSDVPVPLITPSLFAPLPKLRSSSVIHSNVSLLVVSWWSRNTRSQKYLRCIWSRTRSGTL